MSAEERFAVGADVGDETFEEKDDGDTAEEEHKDQESNEFARCDGRRDIPRHELFPGDDRPKVYEHGGVEDEFEDVGERSFFGLVGEPAVRGKCAACAKGYEEVVQAQGRADTDAEEGEKEVESQERRRVDPIPTFRQPKGAVGESPENEAGKESEGALPEDSCQKPCSYDFTSGRS